MQLSGLMSMDGSYFLSCSSNVLSFHDLGWKYLDWLPCLQRIHGWHSWPWWILQVTCLSCMLPDLVLKFPACWLIFHQPRALCTYIIIKFVNCAVSNQEALTYILLCVVNTSCVTRGRRLRGRPTSSYVIRVPNPIISVCTKRQAVCCGRRGGTSQNFAYFKNNFWTRVVPR